MDWGLQVRESLIFPCPSAPLVPLRALVSDLISPFMEMSSGVEVTVNKALDLEAWVFHLALPPTSWVTLGMWHLQPFGLSFPIHVKHSKESQHIEPSY